jgi:hypothetical protein
MPVACIWAYTIVEPTNLNPRFFISLLISSETFVFAGISFKDFSLLLIGFPFTNPQIYLSKVPNSFLTFKNALALVTSLVCFLLYLHPSVTN